MKSTILSAVRDLSADNYFNYLAFLARDFQLPLNLVVTTPPVTVTPNPVAIVGGGLEEPPGLMSDKAFEETRNNIEGVVERLKVIWTDIRYELTRGYIGDRVQDADLARTALMWTINRTSEDNFLNSVFGTVESDFSRSASLPCLNIPDSFKYVKPKSILIVIRGTRGLDLDRVDKIVSTFNLVPTFAFHEDDEHINAHNIMGLLNTGLSRYKGPVKTTLLSDDDEIEQTVNEENPDWMAFINYDRSFFERIFRENINHLLLKYDIPIMTF